MQKNLKIEIFKNFLYLDNKKLSKEYEIDIIAYFAIVQGSADISSFSDESKKIIFSDFPKIRKRLSVPSYLIGQIARNDKYGIKQFDGKIMFNDCHSLIDKAVVISGGSIVVVDCNDDMVNYYR